MRLSSIALLIVGLALAGCNSGGGDTAANTPSSGDSGKPLVVFSQANSGDPWRQMFDRDIKDAAAKHAGHFSYEQTSAQDDPAIQISNIETALVKKPKVLLVSAATEAVGPAVDKAKEQGAFVITLDRGIPGDKWDVHIGGDNREIGRKAGEYLVQRLNGKGTILMIRGIADAAATKDRLGGFMEVVSKSPGIVVIEGDDCGYNRAKAQTFMENFLQSKRPFDAVYAHNDEMAIGALQAMEAAGTPKKIIVGIDGCQKEVIDLIKAGKLDATFKYPGPGPKGIEVAADFLAGKSPTEKNIVLPTELVTKDNADAYMTANPNLS